MTGRWMDDRPRQDPPAGGDPGLPPLDDLDVDRLLDGQTGGAGAVPGYANLAELLAVAAGPPRPDELAGEAPALAAFRAARDAAAAAPQPSATPAAGRAAHAGRAATVQARRAGRRRPALAGRTRRAPALVVALVVVLGGLCATAAAAVVTMSRRPAGTVASTTAPAAGPGSTVAVLPDGVTAPTTSGPSPPRAGVTGPDAARHERANLCDAWRSSSGDGAANKRRAQAFQELAEAAGGADRVEEYCRDAAPATTEPKGKSGENTAKGNGEAEEVTQGPPPHTRPPTGTQWKPQQSGPNGRVPEELPTLSPPQVPRPAVGGDGGQLPPTRSR